MLRRTKYHDSVHVIEALPVSSHIGFYKTIIVTHFSQFYHYFHPSLPVRVDPAAVALVVFGAAEHTSLEHDAYVLMTAQVMTRILHLHHPLKQNFATKRPVHTRLGQNPVLTLHNLSMTIHVSVFFQIVFSYTLTPLHHLTLLNVQPISMYSLIFSHLNINI